MSENVRNSNNRLKILYLYKILLEQTDENHCISMNDIIRELELCGISAGRKALYEDIEALRAYGLDVVAVKGNSAGYYVASREFELPELKLLADAVCSSKFLTVKKSEDLLKKLSSLTSVHEAKQIRRQVYVADRVKSMNEVIYISVDAIHRAIAEKKQISFRYFDYDITKKKKYRDGLRVCSPYAMTWDHERYYLVAYYERYPENFTNFRVDRMENVTVVDEPARLPDGDFSIEEYMNSTFSMFSGEVRDVTMRFDNSLVNAVIDRFGSGAGIFPDGEDRFIVRAKVRAEAPFYAWVFQFGAKAEILSPDDVREKYRSQLTDILDSIYGG